MAPAGTRRVGVTRVDVDAAGRAAPWGSLANRKGAGGLAVNQKSKDMASKEASEQMAPMEKDRLPGEREESPPSRKGARPPGRAAPRQVDSPLGDALRSVYDETVSEDIPAEMLDLLGKLA